MSFLKIVEKLTVGACTSYIMFKIYKNTLNYKKINNDDYFYSGYRFKFLQIENQFIKPDELAIYSDNFKKYGDFVKNNTSDDFIVVKSKNSNNNNMSCINGVAISIDSEACLPHSVLERHNIPIMYDDEKVVHAVLMHEIGHINNKHCDKIYAITFVDNCTLLTALGCSYTKHIACLPILLTITSLSIFLHRKWEYEADKYAVDQGYGEQLKLFFNNHIEHNKKSNSIFITPKGNYLKDIYHPFLTSRINRIDNLMLSNK